MSLDLSCIMRLESRTSPANFDKKSMSFYCDLNSFNFLMGCKDVLLVHINNKTEERRNIVISGMKLFNSLDVRTFKGRKVVIFRY
jgi:hypothetical protein